MQSLFPSQSSRGRRSEPLLSCKAGKCELEAIAGGKFRVTADVRKGQITIVKGNDGLKHFRWGDRNGNVVDDLIIFPEEAKFSKVNTGKAEDRVFLLKFHSGDRRFMFWMYVFCMMLYFNTLYSYRQDKSTAEKDTDVCAQINQLLNDTSTEAAETSSTGVPADAWMQMLGLRGSAAGASAGSNPTPAVPASTAAPSSVSNLDLSSLLGSAAASSQ